jgi:hypothetical protein
MFVIVNIQKIIRADFTVMFIICISVQNLISYLIQTES